MSQPQILALPVVGETTIHRLCLHVCGMARTIDAQHIIYLQSEVNYTRFYLKDGKSYLEAKTLKHFSGILEGPDFIRIHKSYLVNRAHIVSMTPDFVLLRNGLQLPVSRRKRRTCKTDSAIVSMFPKMSRREKWY